MTGDLVEVEEGLLRLIYYNGDKCENGKAGVVNIEFKCNEDVGAVRKGREGRREERVGDGGEGREGRREEGTDIVVLVPLYL